MKTFKQFLILMEELNDRQKAIVDSWGHSGTAARISGHVIPHGQDRITIPLEHHDAAPEIRPHPEVEKHLNAHGYHIHDYKAGLALEPSKPGQTKRRAVKIGAALERTGAEKNVKDAFINDPQRRAAKKTGLQVVISRHPHDVAGMSTNQGWTSCMNMEDGSNAHYLQRDIEHGTHVAFLTHEGDHEAKKPLARIALKPFHAGHHPVFDGPSKGANDTILHPESSTYGTADSAFAHTVKKWTEQHFPLDPEKEYHKNEQVYNDGGHGTLIHHERMFNHENSFHRERAFRDHADKVTPGHINRGINDDDPNVRKAAISHPMATTDQISWVMKHDELSSVRAAAVSHPNADPKHIRAALEHANDSMASQRIAISAMKNPNATSDHVELGLNHENVRVREAAVRHRNATSDHIHRALSDEYLQVQVAAIRNPNARAEHIDRALESGNETLHAEAIRHPKVEARHLDKVLDANTGNGSHPKYMAAQHPKLTPGHIQKILAGPYDAAIRYQAIQHPNASSDNIHMAMWDANSDVRKMAIQHPNATSEHIDEALSTVGEDHEPLRYAALHHPNVTSDHIGMAIRDDSRHVRRAAARHEKATPEHIHLALDDKDRTVREHAIGNPNANSENIHKALDDKSEPVRYAAIYHPNATLEHIEKGIAIGKSNMDHSSVWNVARRRQKMEDYKK
jgi:hypothetical protein